MPLFGNHILSFFSKEHFSNLILGISFGPEILTNIAIVRGIFDFVQNYVGKFIRKLHPIYHSLIDGEKRSKYLRFILNSGNILCYICSFHVFVSRYIISNFKLEKTEFISLIFLLIAIEFTVKFINLYYNNLIILGAKTLSSFLSNFLKMIIVIIFMIVGSFFQNIYILLLGPGVANLISALLIYKDINYKFKFFENRIFQLINFTVYILLFYIIFKN